MNPAETTVLLIDDEERLLIGLAAVMRRAGFIVVTADNGSSGLQAAIGAKPDIIVSDVMMPPPDGFKLREILSNDPKMADIPFLFLTARTSTKDKLRGIENGADDYMTKPFDRDELVARVKAILRRGELGKKQGIKETESKVDTVRSSILDNVSVEMQKPVANMMMNLKPILEERFQGDPERLTEFVGGAIDSVERLSSMVSDLVMLAIMNRDDTFSLPTVVDLEEYFVDPIRRCVDHWKIWEMRDLDVVVNVDEDIVVEADPRAFARAAFHLVDNACKFAPEGSEIQVRLRKFGDTGCVLAVIDQGLGVPKVLQDKVFECFFQADLSMTTQLNAGLGVGLTIAQSVARRFGGDVNFLDTETGCHVQLTIPPSMAS